MHSGSRETEGKLLAAEGIEDVLHPCLGIVEVAFYCANGNVAAFLGNHLLALYGRYASIGVEYADTDAGDIFKAFQCGFACVAGGSGQNQNIFFHTAFCLGCGKQTGQHAQRYILERSGRAAEQFQNTEISNGDGGSQIFGFKLICISCVYQLLHIGNLGQQRAENIS